tara:strand:+ start:19955 stop:20824 length:870 start_codon:yes stop_codon:yes gene_type:complete
VIWTDKLTTNIKGLNMAWVERGAGDPIVFLHGNPTSSYLWRNVIPYLERLGRCIVPDLIGMGDSDKLSNSRSGRYRFTEHREYLDSFLDHVGVNERVTLVTHDWGSALGFDWASRHRESIFGIAYMESIVCPLGWDDWPLSSRPIFKGMRSDAGEELILERNMFIELILPQSILRHLTEEEMNEYKRPFADAGEDRRPMLSWPREIPIEGDPDDIVEIVQSYADWLSNSDVPKLFINAEPGAILVGRQREFCRKWPNQLEVTVPGIHFIQEDSPDEIGQAISGWIKNIS